ncbi:type IV pilus modification PilV family protein [Deinococcus sp. PEB2-63]
MKRTTTQSTPHTPVRATEAFTLVEILVAIGLLAVIMTAVTSLTLGSLGLNRKAQTQVAQTTVAQQLMESVRGAWSATANYDRVCAPITVPAGYTITYIDLDSRATALTGSTAVAVRTNPSGSTINCAAQTVTATIPVMRQIVVTAQGSTPPLTLKLNVVRTE